MAGEVGVAIPAPLTPGHVPEQVAFAAGRVALGSAADVEGSPLSSADPAPVPTERRRWTTYDDAALWIGMSHNIPAYLLASGLVALGMSRVQARHP